MKLQAGPADTSTFSPLSGICHLQGGRIWSALGGEVRSLLLKSTVTLLCRSLGVGAGLTHEWVLGSPFGQRYEATHPQDIIGSMADKLTSVYVLHVSASELVLNSGKERKFRYGPTERVTVRVPGSLLEICRPGNWSRALTSAWLMCFWKTLLEIRCWEQGDEALS